MAEQISNGKSDLGVTVEKRVLIESIACDMDLANALDKGMAFTLHDNAVTPTAAGDYFCKIANTSDYPLVVEQIRINDATGEVNTLEVGANFTSATTHAEIEPINRKFGDVKLASAYGQFESDVDITGMTVTEIGRFKTVTGVDYIHDLTQAPIVLLKNQCLVLKAVTGNIAKAYSVDFYFQTIPVVNG
jgi:hypothetical protein